MVPDHGYYADVGPLAWVGVGFLGLAAVTLSLLILSWSAHRQDQEFFEEADRRNQEFFRQAHQRHSELWQQVRGDQPSSDAGFQQRVREGRRWVEGRSVGDPTDFETSYPAQPMQDWQGEQVPALHYENPQTGSGRLRTLLQPSQGWLMAGVSSLVVGIILIGIGNVWK